MHSFCSVSQFIVCAPLLNAEDLATVNVTVFHVYFTSQKNPMLAALMIILLAAEFQLAIHSNLIYDCSLTVRTLTKDTLGYSVLLVLFLATADLLLAKLRREDYGKQDMNFRKRFSSFAVFGDDGHGYNVIGFCIFLMFHFRSGLLGQAIICVIYSVHLDPCFRKICFTCKDDSIYKRVASKMSEIISRARPSWLLEAVADRVLGWGMIVVFFMSGSSLLTKISPGGTRFLMRNFPWHVNLNSCATDFIGGAFPWHMSIEEPAPDNEANVDRRNIRSYFIVISLIPLMQRIDDAARRDNETAGFDRGHMIAEHGIAYVNFVLLEFVFVSVAGAILVAFSVDKQRSVSTSSSPATSRRHKSGAT
mmetsp:Transcript_35784/g.66206  ORF Transcript_35784/g.66206 Transcript_35784/m.66206 type:complete len:363 (-) Transcript_35784:245-1333(-)